MPQPARKQGHFTYAAYRRWPADERRELIDGAAYAMAPAPTRGHQAMVLEIAAQAHAFLRGSPCAVVIAPFDVRLPKADEADDQIDTLVQPDISVICDSGKLDDAGCRGAPDWVAPKIESVSWERKIQLGIDEVTALAKAYLRAKYTNTDGQFFCRCCQAEMPFKLPANRPAHQESRNQATTFN